MKLIAAKLRPTSLLFRFTKDGFLQLEYKGFNKHRDEYSVVHEIENSVLLTDYNDLLTTVLSEAGELYEGR